MKFFKLTCLLLCLVTVLSCAVPGVRATEPTDPSETETVPQSVQNVPFGSLSTTNGCRTIDGRVPLGGSDRMLDTAQAAFVYERNTDTVIYGYNPDMKLYPGSLLKILTALIAIE